MRYFAALITLILAFIVALSRAHDVCATPTALCGTKTSWKIQNDYKYPVTVTFNIATSLGPSGTSVTLARHGTGGDSKSGIVTAGTTISGRAEWTDGYVKVNWQAVSNLSPGPVCTTTPPPTTKTTASTKPQTTQPPTTTQPAVTTPAPTTATPLPTTMTPQPTTTTPQPTASLPPPTFPPVTYLVPTNPPQASTLPPTIPSTLPPQTPSPTPLPCICDSAHFTGNRPENISESCLQYLCNVNGQCEARVMSGCCGNGQLDSGEQCDSTIANQSACCNATCFGCMGAVKKSKGKALVVGLAVGGTAAVVLVAVLVVVLVKFTALGSRDFATTVKTAFSSASNNPVYEMKPSSDNPTYTLLDKE